MILLKGDKRREKYLKGGDMLKKMRSIGGGGKGCIGGGVVLLVFAAVFLIPCLLIGLWEASLLIGGVFGLPGLLLVVGGKLAYDKKMRHYLSYYQKETGFDEQELRKVEQEIMVPDMVMVGNVPDYNRQGASERNPQIACMITRNYFVAPLIMGESYIRRHEDMILAAYSQEIPGIGGYRYGLVCLSKKDNAVYMNGSITKAVCGEIIGILKEKQPSLITGQRFVYDGKQYNVLTDGEEIVRLFQNPEN